LSAGVPDSNVITSEREADVSRLATDVLKALLPSSFVVAMLFYYGWAYTNAFYLYYGLTPEILNFSTTEYLLRSINVVCRFLLELSLLALLLVLLHRRVESWYQLAENPRLKKRLAWLAIVLGLLGCGLFGPNVHGAFTPYIDVLVACFGLFACLVMIGYSLWLLNRLDPAAQLCIQRLGLASNTARIAFIVLCAAVFFVSSGIYAKRIGDNRAKFWEQQASWLVSVTVYSRHDLAIDDPLVVRDEIESEPEGYRYRYSRLKLLIHTGDEYFVFPTGRSPRAGIIMLRQDDETRIEFEPGAPPPDPVQVPATTKSAPTAPAGPR
jgi:hypothetical protein